MCCSIYGDASDFLIWASLKHWGRVIGHPHPPCLHFIFQTHTIRLLEDRIADSGISRRKRLLGTSGTPLSTSTWSLFGKEFMKFSLILNNKILKTRSNCSRYQEISEVLVLADYITQRMWPPSESRLLEIYSHRKPKSNPCWALGLSQTDIQEDDVKGSQLNSARKAARIARANSALFFFWILVILSFRWQNFWRPLEGTLT